MPEAPATKRCASCGQTKPREEFWFTAGRKGRRSLRGSCKDCSRAQRDARFAKANESLEGLARRMMMAKRLKVRNRYAKNGTSDDPRQVFELDPAWFARQWRLQRGRCYYSRVPMCVGGGSFHVTIERVNSSIGYTQSNCVLVCAAANIMKNQLQLPEFAWWCRRLSRYLKVAPEKPSGKNNSFLP